MASITKAQIEKANEKLGNGFKLDVYYYLTHGEKTAIKRISIGDNVYATLKLMYKEEYATKEGSRMKFPTGRQIPVCHISKEFERETGVLVSYGLGNWVDIGEPQNKKMFSFLQKLSHTIDLEKMVKLAGFEPNTIEESKSLGG